MGSYCCEGVDMDISIGAAHSVIVYTHRIHKLSSPLPGVRLVTTALKVWMLRSAVQMAHTRTRRRSGHAKSAQLATSATTP